MSKTLFYIKSHKKHTLFFVSFIIMIFGLSVSSFTNYSNYLLFPVFALWVPYIFTPGNTLSKNERSFIRASFLFMLPVVLQGTFDIFFHCVRCKRGSCYAIHLYCRLL